jgi:hypothetical protein
VRNFAETLHALANLASTIGLDTTSHEASRLANAASVAADYVELGLMVAAANQPTAMTWYASATIGAGHVRAPDRQLAGELAVTAGVAVSGPTCTLLDASGRASLSTSIGPTIAESGRVCLGAIPLENEDTAAAYKVEVLAINAFESVGLNVRPGVEAAAVIDSGRFALAEAGLSVEGIRWYWRPRWSVAAPGVSMSQAFLTRKVNDDRQSLARVAASAWFAELRYHRSPAELTDFALRLFPIAADTIESGEAINTLSLVPLEITGLGTHGVYVDAAGGLDVTAEQEGDTPQEIASKPDVGKGSWRLALHLGVPRAHLDVENRQHLLPTLADSVVVERRTSASLHVDVGWLFIQSEAYRAHLRLYSGSGETVDAAFDTWGVQGEAWIRAGRHLLIGATVETGRSFVFAEPSSSVPTTLDTPPLGHLVLAQIGWRTGATSALD